MFETGNDGITLSNLTLSNLNEWDSIFFSFTLMHKIPLIIDMETSTYNFILTWHVIRLTGLSFLLLSLVNYFKKITAFFGQAFSRPYTTINHITVTACEAHGVLIHCKLEGLFKNVIMPKKKTLKLRITITILSLGKAIGWMLITNGQWCLKHSRDITSPYV